MLRPFLLAALLLCSTSLHAALPEAVARLLHAAQIEEDAVGVIVVRGDTVLLAQNAGRSMQPASTMKLLTSLVALEQLGPAFRARTELRSSAAVVDGVLQGDLILRGGADPDFNADALRHLLQTLRQQGITDIAGDLLIDRALFQPVRPDLDAAPFDDSPQFHYNVIPDALLLNANMVQIDLHSHQQKLQLLLTPAMDGVTLTSDMTLSATPCAQWGAQWRQPDSVRAADGKLTITLHGSFPAECAQTTSINVLDRQDYAEQLFRTTWRALGGALRGAVHETPAGSDAAEHSRLLAVHISRTLPEILRDINKPSDNTLARLLFLSLGSLESDAVLGSRPRLFLAPELTAERAGQAVQLWLQLHHIDAGGLVLENGSGLSRLERISPLQLAAVLQAGQRSAWAPEFLSSLPIAGLDGTMGHRLRDSVATGRARIKSGSLRNVSAVAGYVLDANNEQCVLVAFINDERAGAGRAALDALIEWVAQTARTVK